MLKHLFAMLVLAPVVAHADTVLSPVGPQTDSVTVEAGQAVAATFNVLQPLRNVRIEFNATCLGCQGGVFVNGSRLGPEAYHGDTISATPFASNGQFHPAAQFQQLNPGTYFVVLAVEHGAVIVSANASGHSAQGGRATRGLDFIAHRAEAWGPASDFDPMLTSVMQMAITAD
ncbi:MAG: hypothetical protein H6898_01720 [Rhodobacter sp.]|nr:hypothetical protein [Paracoccaceae bacterium]MCC0075290.1 hypothetical protein [Rhodobacter sp.]